MPFPSIAGSGYDDDQPYERTWGPPEAPPKEISSFKPKQEESAGLAPKIDTPAPQSPTLSPYEPQKPKSLSPTTAPGEQIPQNQMARAEGAFHQTDPYHGMLKSFGDRRAMLDHLMPTNVFDPNHNQDLVSYSAERNHINEQEAQFKQKHPYGSVDPETGIENHPGFWGKLGHVMGVVGDVAAPGIAERIPGSQLNLKEQEREAEAGLNKNIEQGTNLEKAQAATSTAATKQDLADLAAKIQPQKVDILDRHQTTDENKLPNQLGTDIAAGGDIHDPNASRIIPAMQAAKAATTDKFQHVAGTVDGKPAFGAFNPADHKFYDPQTGAPLDNFVPPPNFAQTGSFQTTMVATPEGGMVPGTLNARTGQVNVPHAGSNVAIPKDVQTEVNKELDTARNADRRLAIMEHNYETALKGDQQAMISLVANHIGMTLGAQKGARINQAVWNEAVASRPWLQGAQAKFDSRGYLSGVTLSPQQMQQMVSLAKEVRDQQWGQVTQTFGNYGIPYQQQSAPAETSGGGDTGRPSVAEWLKKQTPTH